MLRPLAVSSLYVSCGFFQVNAAWNQVWEWAMNWQCPGCKPTPGTVWIAPSTPATSNSVKENGWMDLDLDEDSDSYMNTNKEWIICIIWLYFPESRDDSSLCVQMFCVVWFLCSSAWTGSCALGLKSISWLTVNKLLSAAACCTTEQQAGFMSGWSRCTRWIWPLHIFALSKCIYFFIS